MQCFYILGISLLIELLISGLVALNFAPEPFASFLAVEELHYDAWLIFWAAATVLYFIEYRIRRYYLKHAHETTFSSLLALILRTLILFSVTLWLAKYVLNWHTTHILVSATALTAIAGFALKGTIGDLLAGVSLHMSQAVVPSQWISLPRLNIEGEVITTNWRETRLRTTSGHIHILPNSLLARQNFHNMSWPDNHRRHNLDFILSTDNDPADVEQALLKAAQASPQILNDPKPPQVIIKAYLEFGINYQLRVWSKTLYDPSALENAVYRAAWNEFRQRHITFLQLSATQQVLRKAE